MNGGVGRAVLGPPRLTRPFGGQGTARPTLGSGMSMYYPNLQEFQKLAVQGNLVPVTRRLLADIETPLSAYRKIRGPAESFLFESVEGGEHLGRYSFVGCSPRAIIRQLGDRVEVLENGKVVSSYSIRALKPGSLEGAAASAMDGEVHDGL